MRDPERLSRDKRQLIALLDIFAKVGVGVLFSTESGQRSYQFLRVLVSALAEFEEAKKSVRQQ
jgi:DNA invertase Pin-like site-specific DNA recombinase